MAVTAVFYNSFKKKIVDGTNIDLDTDTIKVALVKTTYTPDIDTHDFFNDVSAEESSGTGYTAGGATLANVTLTVDTSNDRAVFDADNTAWTISSALAARYAVIYKSTGNAATSPLIGYVNLDADYSLASGTLTLTWNATGIITIT